MATVVEHDSTHELRTEQQHSGLVRRQICVQPGFKSLGDQTRVVLETYSSAKWSVEGTTLTIYVLPCP